MSLWHWLENNLQSRIEGLFGRRFQSQVQPVEIAKRLVRAMTAGRTVSVTAVYAPNCFEVFLGPGDWEHISPLVVTFGRELEEYLKKMAVEEGYRLVGEPRVSFSVDEGLALGSVRVDSWYSEKVAPEQPVGTKTPPGGVPGGEGLLQGDAHGQTKVFFGQPRLETAPPCATEPDRTRILPTESAAAFKPIPAPANSIWLYVVEGPDIRQAFPQGVHAQVLGRKGDSDIQLNDPRVSRRHAKLEVVEGKLVLTDLGSLNGTFVNGSRVAEQELKTGDLVKVGETVFEVRTD